MVEIKKATLANLKTIQNISKQSFTETFSAVNTPENIENYVEENFNTEQIISEINNPNSTFYLAFYNEEPIGYLKINLGNAQIEFQKDNTLEIQRIYVLQAFQGKKIGQLLLDQALKVAQQINVDYIWLGVWEENHKAIPFYTKNGFITFDKHLFILGNEKQTDLLMKLNIKHETK